MPIFDAGDRFRPRQRGALAFRVVRRFLPGIKPIEALLIFADGTQVFPMHINAVGTTVDLGGPQFNEIEQRFFQPQTGGGIPPAPA
jgi:hypothetical protein